MPHKRNRQLIECVCPVCGEHADDATAMDLSKVKPKAGDLTVCLYCSALLQFVLAPGKRKRLAVRELSEQDLLNLPSATLQELSGAQKVATYVRRKHPELNQRCN